MPTRWDVQILVRAALAAALALSLAWLITAATDEGGVAWSERAGRTLPLTPACAAIGAWVALAPVRSRGEALALSALGRSRAQVAAAAVAGAALVALAAAALIGGNAAIDITAFFPRAAHASVWAWQGGAFVDHVRGVQIGLDGAPVPLTRTLREAAPPIPPYGRMTAAMAIAFAGLALPLISAHFVLDEQRMRAGRARGDVAAVLASVGAIAVSIVLFQAAAARLVPSILAVTPPIALLAFALHRYRASP